MFLKVAKNSHSSFDIMVVFFKLVPKVTDYLDYFCKKIRRKEFLKIAQSGHSAMAYNVGEVKLYSENFVSELCQTWNHRQANLINVVFYVRC